MQATSPLMQILQYLDNLVVVLILVIITIGIRFLWQRHRKNIPAPALTSARSRQQQGVEVATPARPKDIVLEIIDLLLIALILVFGIVRPLFLETFFIPTPSMVPTLNVDDRLIANKFIFRFRNPEHGEVIVFKPPVEAVEGNSFDFNLQRYAREYPHDINALEWRAIAFALSREGRGQTGMTVDKLNLIRQVANDQIEEWMLAQLQEMPEYRDNYIKRVIGVQGDRIHFADGRVYINGKQLPELYLQPTVTTTPVTFQSPSPRPRLNIQEISSLDPDSQDQRIQKFGEDFLNWLMKNWYYNKHLYEAHIHANMREGDFIVPPNSVFVMGDNRSQSFDSRYWGAVPLHEVKARAISTFWPLNRLKLL